MIEGLKPLYNGILTPVAQVCIALRLHPNVVTLFGVAISGIATVFAASGHWVLAASTIIAGSLMDGLDGLIARLTQKKSVFGAVLDSTCDRLTEFLWFLGILIFYVTHPVGHNWGIYLSFIAMSGSVMVSYIRARCEGAHIQCSEGLLQRPERIILIVLCFFAGSRFMIFGLLLISLLAYVTVIQRLFVAYSTGKKL